jgi:hypothetical protein
VKTVRTEFKGRKACPGPSVHKVPQVLKAAPENKVYPGLQVHRAPQVNKESPGLPVLRDAKDLPVKAAAEDRKVSPDLPDHKELRVNLLRLSH